MQNVEALDMEEYIRIMQQLCEDFERRFQDIRKLEQQFKIFATHFSVNVLDIPAELQLEMIDLQNDIELKDKYENRKSINHLYILVFHKKFPKLLNLAARTLCMFGTTYVCETLFSLMKFTKSRHRSQLSDEHLKACLRLGGTKTIAPRIEKLLTNRKMQKSLLISDV